MLGIARWAANKDLLLALAFCLEGYSAMLNTPLHTSRTNKARMKYHDIMRMSWAGWSLAIFGFHGYLCEGKHFKRQPNRSTSLQVSAPSDFSGLVFCHLQISKCPLRFILPAFQVIRGWEDYWHVKLGCPWMSIDSHLSLKFKHHEAMISSRFEILSWDPGQYPGRCWALLLREKCQHELPPTRPQVARNERNGISPLISLCHLLKWICYSRHFMTFLDFRGTDVKRIAQLTASPPHKFLSLCQD